jgi:hypothetical protein
MNTSLPANVPNSLVYYGPPIGVWLAPSARWWLCNGPEYIEDPLARFTTATLYREEINLVLIRPTATITWECVIALLKLAICGLAFPMSTGVPILRGLPHHTERPRTLSTAQANLEHPRERDSCWKRACLLLSSTPIIMSKRYSFWPDTWQLCVHTARDRIWLWTLEFLSDSITLLASNGSLVTTEL